jgi:hypothetical protein
MSDRLALGSTAPRLRQLILLLSSNQPGEVVAAAGAITRTLRSVGADWHLLVDNLLPDEQLRHPRVDDDGWHRIREFCLSRDYLLRPRERDFLIDLDRWDGDLTDKQSKWLSAIYARVASASGKV